MSSREWAEIMEVEDSLQGADVFYNGFTGRRNCHSDSYGTCVDFAKLDAWLEATKTGDKAFSPDRLRQCVTYWQTNANMQPPLRIVAAIAARWLEKQA